MPEFAGSLPLPTTKMHDRLTPPPPVDTLLTMLHLTTGLNLLATSLASSFFQSMPLKKGWRLMDAAPSAPLPRRSAGSRMSSALSRDSALEDLCWNGRVYEGTAGE